MKILHLFSCYLSSILSSSPVSNTPLEVSLWIGLDEGVDGTNTSWRSMIGWGWVIGWSWRSIGWRSISPHSVNWSSVKFSIIKDENSARGGAHEGEK